MSDQPGLTPKKTVLLVLLVFGVGVAGVLSGHLIRDLFLDKQTHTLTTQAPRSLLKRGQVFPDVIVLTETQEARRTHDLIGRDGAVVLFLDLECPPCTDMSIRWQQALDSGDVEGLNVIGVTNHPLAIVGEYKRENDLRFPVVTDTSHTFHEKYEVDRFPLEVVIDKTGRIRSTSYDSRSPIDYQVLESNLGRN